VATDRVVPFSNMRRRTAEHMVRSKQVSPHAFIATEADFENVERVRRSAGERFRAEEGYSLTYLPFVARAAVEALRQFPYLNASVGEDALVVHQEVNLGIAVDLNHEGLIVPVVHRAEEVTLRGMARRIRDLADRARHRQLQADDIVGGTFSITNDGPFGTFFTVPIINQPQVAILATDGVKRRPVVVTAADGSESIAIHSTALLGMSWDHRAVDGAYVASFLGRVVELLATRDWGAEL
jgi:2-oxoglutarate dehydrogenase E2 component (dihydrolipoamide succinyltransferase)